MADGNEIFLTSVGNQLRLQGLVLPVFQVGNRLNQKALWG